MNIVLQFIFSFGILKDVLELVLPMKTDTTRRIDVVLIVQTDGSTE